MVILQNLSENFSIEHLWATATLLNITKEFTALPLDIFGLGLSDQQTFNLLL